MKRLHIFVIVLLQLSNAYVWANPSDQPLNGTSAVDVTKYINQATNAPSVQKFQISTTVPVKLKENSTDSKFRTELKSKIVRLQTTPVKPSRSTNAFAAAMPPNGVTERYSGIKTTATTLTTLKTTTTNVKATTKIIPSAKTKFFLPTTLLPKKALDETVDENFGIKLFKEKSADSTNIGSETEPKIMEIMTKITDLAAEKQNDGMYGPRIDGIEARFEPVKHSIPVKLKERLDALSCEVPPLPSESTLWYGNETRDLVLPITVPTECDPDDVECPYGMSLIWEASTEIQSGEVLVVRIDDKTLRRDLSEPEDSKHKESQTAVYQVNRSGHDHCDINDGTLLDITPTTVDGNKIITLYDKDLTEGINLLIVVSQNWGSQCIRLKVTVKSDNCGENADCSNKGVCFSNVSMEGFECQCCQGYIGPHCEEKDACYPSPCKSNSICVDLSQGHDGETFQCLCPYGYTGKTCEERTDPCESSPCENGGKCIANQTEFKCECPSGYTGDTCQHLTDPCAESPCKHGICVSREDGFKCFCRPGFAGDNCEYEYNECESSPCLNGGTCIDQIGGYQCLCGRGYNGKRCHIKVDLCDPEPCPEGRICEDRGNNYSCECPRGFSGLLCNKPLKAICSNNPCKHGGTCWSSVNSFYCACRPGYSGKTCTQVVGVEEAQTIPKFEEEDQSGDFDNQNIPLSMRIDKLHNIYIAVGTLSCALFIVILTVAACHCRVHETYKRCFLKSTPLLPCKIRKLDILPKHSRTVKPLLGYPKDNQIAMPTPTRNFPTLDTTDVYYTLDFSDNQNAPLIQ